MLLPSSCRRTGRINLLNILMLMVGFCFSERVPSAFFDRLNMRRNSLLFNGRKNFSSSALSTGSRTRALASATCAGVLRRFFFSGIRSVSSSSSQLSSSSSIKSLICANRRFLASALAAMSDLPELPEDHEHDELDRLIVGGVE